MMRLILLTVALMCGAAHGENAVCVNDMNLYYCDVCQNLPMLCYGCAPGSIVKDDHTGCLDCADNCAECVTDGALLTKCTLCAAKYYMNSLGVCVECGTNCAECTDTDCTACIFSKYYVKSNTDPKTCIGCGSNCETCTADSLDATTCSSCRAGYYKDATKSCKGCVSKCISCSTADVCTKCADNYKLSSDASKCLPCDTGCTNCVDGAASTSLKATCDACADGYYLDTANALCEPCAANCFTCTSASVCTQCDPQYFLSGGSCSNCPWACKTCDSATTCSACNARYALKDKISVTCDVCPSNCQTCTISGAVAGTCSICKSGYALDSSAKCKACSSNCNTCSFSASVNRCGSCATGFFYDNTDNGCMQCPLNCASGCSYNTTIDTAFCTNCDNYFGKKVDGSDTSTCYACPVGSPNCGYNTTLDAFFSRCSNQAAPDTTTGTNQYRGTCTSGTSCDKGYFYDDSGSYPTCTTCGTVGCVHCNSTTTPATCLTCDTTANYASTPKSDGSCFACSSVHSQCSVCSWDAALVPAAYKCTACKTGYVVKDNTCTACGALCGTCTVSGSTTSCGTCKANAIKDTTVTANCLGCVSPCTDCEWDSATSTTVCKSSGCPTLGYAFNSADKTCTACMADCQECEYVNSVLQCKDTRCASGFGNSRDFTECIACPKDCPICKVDGANLLDNNLYCDTCAAGFVKNDEFCTPCTSLCAECKNEQGSVEATKAFDAHYVDSATKTCKKCPSQCLKCSQNSCSKCADGYGLSQDKQSCTACGTLAQVPECSICTDADNTGNSTCMNCTRGFFLSDDSKFCNDTTLLGDKCNLFMDMEPECLTCDSDKRYVNDEGECVMDCYVCGVQDEFGYVVDYGTPADCNVDLTAESGNSSASVQCHIGCSSAASVVDGDITGASRGCAMNETCPIDGTSACEGPDKKNKECFACCEGNFCNGALYDSACLMKASLEAILLVFLATLLFLR